MHTKYQDSFGSLMTPQNLEKLDGTYGPLHHASNTDLEYVNVTKIIIYQGLCVSLVKTWPLVKIECDSFIVIYDLGDLGN